MHIIKYTHTSCVYQLQIQAYANAFACMSPATSTSSIMMDNTGCLPDLHECSIATAGRPPAAYFVFEVEAVQVIDLQQEGP